MIKYILIIFLLGMELGLFADSFELTQEEKEYLKQNIKVAYTIQFEPNLFVDNTGRVQGIIPDVYNLISEKYNIKFEYILSDWNSTRKNLQLGKVDIIPSIAKTVAQKSGFLLASPFSIPTYAIFTRDDTGKINSLDDLKGLKLTYNKNAIIFAQKLSKYKDIKLVPSNDTLDGFLKLENGEVDALFSFSRDEYFVTTYELNHIVKGFTLEKLRGETATAIKPNDPLLQSIINKAILSLSRDDVHRINAKYSGENPTTKLSLSQKEKEFLKTHKEFTLCDQYGIYPISAVQNTKLVGITGEIYDAISKELHIKFNPIEPLNAKDLDNLARDGRCDFVSLLMDKQKRFPNIRNTEIVFHLPIVSLGNLESFYIDDKTSFEGHTFIVRTGVLKKTLLSSYPNLKVVMINNVEEALNRVQKDVKTHYVLAKPIAEQMISHYGFDKYKINGVLDQLVTPTTLGVNENMPILLSIINKTLLNMDKEVINKAFNKYAIKEYKIETTNYTLVYIIVSIFILIYLILWYRKTLLEKLNSSLEHKVSLRTQELKESNTLLFKEKERFELAVDGADNGIFDWDIQSNQIYYSPRWKSILGYKDKEIGNSYNEWEQRVHPDDVSTTMKVLKEYLEGESELFSANFRMKHKDGHWVWINGRGKVSRDSEGKPTRLVGFNTDVTEIVEYRNSLEEKVASRTKELQEANENLERFIDTQDNIVILTDGKTITFANKKFFDTFGYKDLEAFQKEHQCICELFIRDDKFFHLGKINEEGNWIEEIDKLTPSNKIVSIKGTDSKVYAFSVSIKQFNKALKISSFTDISQTMLEHFRLEEKTIRDKLTGAYNREYFEQNYKQLLKKYNQGDSHLAIAMLDIDHFKLVNDTYGHSVGDDVLIQLVKTIQKYSREDDTLIRWGGEEFILILRVNSKENLTRALEHLRKVLELQVYKQVGQKTCSIGGTLYQKSEEIETTIQRADKAVYDAKAKGRNRIVIF